MRAAIGPALVAMLLATADAGAQARPGIPVYREFGDWIVACDVTGACEARGFVDGGEHLLYPVLVRGAGASAEPVLEIRDLPPRGEAIRLDGREWRPATPSALAWAPRDAENGEGRLARIRGTAAVRDFVAAARRAGRVTIGDESGTLAGFNAAVLFVDDVQGRVGTPGALARPGNSARAVPPPRPLPVAPVAARGIRALGEAEARRYATGLPIPGDACHAAPDDAAAALYDLGDGEVLALVRCWSGPYQSSDAIYRGPRSAPARARPVVLPYPPGIEAGAPDTGGEPVTGVEFDPRTATLSSFGKARGLADCGDSAAWVFDGRDFVLTEYALLGRCGWYAPADFPVLWRTAPPRGARP